MMSGGGDGDLAGGRMFPAASFQLQMSPATGEIAGTSGGGGGGQRGKEEKVPLWGQQETRDLIAVRADLERDFNVSRRNKTVWEVVAMRMREKGYRRTADQCKCKWKNLVNRYKGKETTDAESGRQCPFFEELHALFSERARNTHRLLLESESGAAPPSKKKPRKLGGGRSSDELSDDDDYDEDDSEEEKPVAARGKKKKAAPQQQKSKTVGSIHDLLHEFLQQQQQLEAHWWDAMDRRAQERQRFDQEWRSSMEKLERERLMLEQVWREREEQRRMREENRAEKRDALLTTLLNKLIQDDP